MASAKYLEKQRDSARKRRTRRGEAPVVHFFHQVDDPYSHLAVQKLDVLKTRYDLRFQVHLTSKPEPAYLGSSAHFDLWARQDALSVAAAYGTVFAPSIDAPSSDAIAAANHVLANHLAHEDFATLATSVGQALWAGDVIDQAAPPLQGERAVQVGNAKRQALGHYQGGMFYFEGEWFWGIDRIRLLEKRLAAEGYDKTPGPLSVPEPTPLAIGGKTADGIVLEYFPSLRSPYTAIGHQRVLDLIKQSGVSVTVRPVMPMLMRGIPAPRAKQRYIITDAAREGREHGVPFGPMVDPFGEPVKRAFALFPAANAQGLGLAFITAYLNAAWFEGVDITTERGLQQVSSSAGISWQSLKDAAHNKDWEALLAGNLAVLTQENLWGVPSFRVSGGKLSEPYACWGQDRIWRVAHEIARRA